jgi:hypothetical protein
MVEICIISAQELLKDKILFSHVLARLCRDKKNARYEELWDIWATSDIQRRKLQSHICCIINIY